MKRIMLRFSEAKGGGTMGRGRRRGRRERELRIENLRSRKVESRNGKRKGREEEGERGGRGERNRFLFSSASQPASQSVSLV